MRPRWRTRSRANCRRDAGEVLTHAHTTGRQSWVFTVSSVRVIAAPESLGFCQRVRKFKKLIDSLIISSHVSFCQ